MFGSAFEAASEAEANIVHLGFRAPEVNGEVAARRILFTSRRRAHRVNGRARGLTKLVKTGYHGFYDDDQSV